MDLLKILSLESLKAMDLLKIQSLKGFKAMDLLKIQSLEMDLLNFEQHKSLRDDSIII